MKIELFYRMVTNLHLLLTYRCTLKCDHCYVFGSPQAKGIYSLKQVNAILNQAKNFGSIQWIYYEGGEPFLVYPLLLKGVHTAKRMGFNVGVISNGSFARSNESAIKYLRPLIELGLTRLYVSNDHYHYRNPASSLAKRAIQAARQLNFEAIEVQVGLPKEISAQIEPLFSKTDTIECATRNLMLIGRAAMNLVIDLPKDQLSAPMDCPYPDLADPKNISIDPYGHLHICPGIALGNVWEKSLTDLLKDTKLTDHPILGPIIRGGPGELCRVYQTQPMQVSNNPCFNCYQVRRSLLDRFPQYLAPRQVYGL